MIGHKEIQITVIIIVSPAAAKRRPLVSHNRSGRYPAECTVSIIIIKKIILVRAVGHVQIQITIVVIISPAASLRFAPVIDNTARSHLGKSSIPVIMVEKIVLVIVIGDKQIQMTVIVIIYPCGITVPYSR